MTEHTTAAALLAQGAQQLRASLPAAVAATAALDAQLLLAHTLGLTRSRLLAQPETPVGPNETQRYQALLQRRAGCEPVAYLTGRREFWSLDLAVTPAVLVPRPETELLVERALTVGPTARARVADLGTGSGAIALALARERPHWHVLATELSDQALAVARTNAAALGLTRIEFRLGDWYLPLGAECFDLLVSNPPYVAGDDPALVDLRHEPRLALSPGEDAFAALRTLVGGAAQHLVAGGWLLLEHGATQGERLREELVLAGFRHVRSHPDLAGHERITEGQR